MTKKNLVQHKNKGNTSKASGFISLRYRFIIITSLMLVFLLASLAIILEKLQTNTIRSRIEKHGLTIAKNLATISVDDLLAYNYVELEKLTNQAANSPDIIYVIIHDKEGIVAGHSKRAELQNKMLTDKFSLNAVKVKKPLITIHTPADSINPVMHVAVPVYLPNSRKTENDRWGTIRVCLSLELMRQQIQQTRLTIFILGFIFLFIGILISNWSASRVTKSLETLVKVTVEVAKGNFKQKISINTRDEVEILATNFSYMIEEVLTQRQQLENQVKEIIQLKQYAEKILDTMSDGLLIIGMDKIIITANPVARDILGISLEHIAQGCSVIELFNKDKQFLDYIQNAIENPLRFSNQQEIYLQRGEDTRIILTDLSVLKADGKNNAQIIFNINDITILKKLETEIRENQRLADLGIMAASIAHEVRNPIAAIQTYVEMLPKKIKKPMFMDEFQSIVSRQINRITNLTEELLVLSKPLDYQFGPTNIYKLLQHSIKLLKISFENQRIDCRLDIPNELPLIMADGDQLEKVFINLMQNAEQAMPNGGTIVVSAFCKNSCLIIKFKDTGYGFSPETAKNIFNPFFTTKAKGTGLGLAISHKVILGHGGQLKAKSKEKEGACFSISLPENNRTKNQ